MTHPAPHLSVTWTEPPSGDPVRGETRCSIAALAFLEGTSQLGTFASLRAWFIGDVVPNRWAPGWDSLREPGLPASSLSASPDPMQLRRLLRAARDRVVEGLRGLVWTPRDDSWISALVHQGYVRCEKTEQSGVMWTVEVPRGRALSDLVLALFAADILARRALYDERLCVCSSCGRVSFDPACSGRLGCPAHPVRPSAVSPQRYPRIAHAVHRPESEKLRADDEAMRRRGK